MYITQEQFQELFPKAKNSQEWVALFDRHLPDYGFHCAESFSDFLAQLAHESAHFTAFEENLNYSKEGLLKVFPKYFDAETAEKYARKPQAIANRVYANRMGNGEEFDGDGWKYRGRGPIQCTGKKNYAKCSKFIYNDEEVLLRDPDVLAQIPEVGLLSALWYWDEMKLIDVTDFRQLTRKINGGLNGFDDRLRLRDQIYEMVKEEPLDYWN